jgi:hypothetical protein
LGDVVTWGVNGAAFRKWIDETDGRMTAFWQQMPNNWIISGMRTFSDLRQGSGSVAR